MVRVATGCAVSALVAASAVPCNAGAFDSRPAFTPLPSLNAWDASVDNPLALHLRDAEFALPDTGPIEGLTSRGFTGRLPGSTLRMRPGETLHVNVINELDPAQNVLCEDLANDALPNPSYCDATTMNLHTHGLHVSSKGKHDGLPFPSDDIFQIVSPNTSQAYAFAIPDYHAPGTHWYHSHWHHSTALGAGGGAAGALIVEDPPGYLPDEYANMPEHLLMLLNFQFQNLATVATESKSVLLEDAPSVAEANGLPSDSVFLVNGQIGPELEVQANTWNRLRTVYAAINDVLDLRFESDDGAVCQMQLLAKDGIYVTDFPRFLPKGIAHLVPGARADIITSCTCTDTVPCHAVLTSKAADAEPTSNAADAAPTLKAADAAPTKGKGKGSKAKAKAAPHRLFGFKKHRKRKMGDVVSPEGISSDVSGRPIAANVDLMVLKITKGPKEPTVLSSPTLPRPCYLVDMREAALDGPAHTLAMTFNQDPQEGFENGRAITWDGVGESMNFLNMKHQRALTPGQFESTEGWPPLGNITVGGVHEFTVEGGANHMFHVHVNPFQITKLPAGLEDATDGYYKEGDFQDTLMIPGLTGLDLPTVRVQTDKFTGHIVVHCHLLMHEDSGMIGYFDIVGEEGTVWPGAKEKFPTCYNVQWAANKKEVPSMMGQRLRRHHISSGAI